MKAKVSTRVIFTLDLDGVNFSPDEKLGDLERYALDTARKRASVIAAEVSEEKGIRLRPEPLTAANLHITFEDTP